MDVRIIGLAAGMAASVALPTPAHAESSDGLTFEVTASAAEIDVMSAHYGGFLSDDHEAISLLEQTGSDSGTRYDVRASGFDWNVFGAEGEAYLRGSFQEVSSDASIVWEDYLWALVPTGFEGFDEFQALGDDNAGGRITSARALEQREGEIAAGVVFRPWHGIAPRVEIGYRRGEIEQTMASSRIGVTPMFEEFALEESALNSDCADLSFGGRKVMPLGSSLSFVADVSAGAGYCRHDLEVNFAFDTQTNNSYTGVHEDDLASVSAHGALSAGLVWQVSDRAALGFNAFARGDSDAPYIAYPTYTYPNGLPAVTGDVLRLETESRMSYGAGLSLRIALE